MYRDNSAQFIFGYSYIAFSAPLHMLLGRRVTVMQHADNRNHHQKFD
jgi:hypothetical protein